MQVLRFDVFTLDLSRCAVLRGDKALALRPKAFDVLRHLAEHAGRVVSKDELFRVVWPDTTVTDDSLVQCIKDIRQALGDNGHRIIETVPKRGYLLAAEVIASASPANLEMDSDAPPSSLQPAAVPRGGWQARQRPLMAAALLITVLVAGGWVFWERLRPAPPAALTMMAVPSIAVLPFTAVGEERDVAGALAGDIETELSRMPRGYNMRIRSAPGYKASVRYPRGAGRELGVRYLVLGSTRREGDVRQVNVQLIEAESGRPVWAEPFTYAPGEPGAQSRIAARIARMLNAQVLRAETRLPLPTHAEAGHFVMLGRALMSGERGVEVNRKAIAYFDKARALDPYSVPALQGYARTRVNHVLNRWAPKEQGEALLNEAEAAIKRAFGLEPREPGLHVARGAYLRARGKDAEAIAAFEHAIHLHPNYPLAHAELGRAKIEVGRASETVGHIEEAIRLSATDSYVASWYYWAAMAEVHVGRYKSAVDWLLKVRQANRAYPNTIPWLAVAYAGLGEWEEARAYVEEHRTNVPKFSLSGWRLALPHSNQTVAAQRARIEALLRQLGAPENPPDSKVQTGSVR